MTKPKIGRGSLKEVFAAQKKARIPRSPRKGLSAEQVRRANKSDLAAARRTRMRMVTTPAAIERREEQIKRNKGRVAPATVPYTGTAVSVPPRPKKPRYRM